MARRKTTKEFIEEANKIHNNKYDYSLTEYIGSQKKVKIICPEHGEFEQNASDHLRGIGCKKCSNILKSKKTIKSKENFIIRARKIHGDRYQYLGEYKGLKSDIEILCPEHGSFIKKASSHLNGVGCPQCKKMAGSHRKLTTGEFIARAKKIHGDLYNYSKTEYVGSQKKVKIICPEHGEFEQTPNDHLTGSGCPYCAKIKKGLKLKNSIEDFINMSKLIHGTKYDYSLVNYHNLKTKVIIICPEHGEFKQKPNGHVNGRGCPFCGGTQRLTHEEFINRAKKIHNNKYEYPQEYCSQNKKIEIICPTCGSFMQRPNDHLNGHGCPKCALSGFNPDKPAILYYLKDTETGLYKIGISNKKSIEERFGKAFCSKRAIALKEQSFISGQEALEYEQEILEQFAYARCINSSWPEKLGGRTEFFKYDILGLDSDG